MYFDFFCYTPLARTTTLLLSRGFPFPSPCTEKQARRRQDPSPRRGLEHKSVMFQTSADSRGPLTVSLVVTATDSGPDQGLLFVQDGEDAKDDGCTCLELDVHQALRHGFANVLKVHGGSLDKASDSDDGVEWGGGRGRGLGRGLGLLGGRGVVDE